VENDYKKIVLENGLNVYLKNTSSQTLSARLDTNAGSCYEQIGENGLAHFLEHCLVNSRTQKYNLNDVRNIQKQFGYFNSYTNLSKIGITGEVLASDSEKLLNYLSEVLFYPMLDEQTIEQERKKIIQEIDNNYNNEDFNYQEKIRKILYAKHPLEKNPLGNKFVIKQAKKDQINSYYRSFVSPCNTDLIIVGNLPKDIEYIIQNEFSNIPSGVKHPINIPTLTNSMTNRENVYQYYSLPYSDPYNQHSDLSLYYNFDYPTSTKDKFILSIISSILENKILRNITEKKGLVYPVKTRINTSYNAGILEFIGEAPATKIHEAKEEVFYEMNKMKENKISEDELGEAKNKALFNYYKKYESNTGITNLIREELDNNYLSEEGSDYYNSITTNDILRVANNSLPDEIEDKYITFIKSPIYIKDKI